ncbi:MAG: PQQ-dependent sugar dehydrogenase [Wenzhouxiangella sp.]|jgi:glucose/arabinose dehydrogenase|nr:PQQ-dependent sugar dehydrogenase [Wenzhouxiangella sp.]
MNEPAKVSTLRSFALGACWALSIVGTVTPALPAEPQGCDLLDSVPATPAVDFDTQIQPLFNDLGCTGCHGEWGAAGLNLLPGASWAALVGQPATTNPDRLRVEPFRPDRSTLLHSVNCDIPGGPAFRMDDPMGNPLTLADQALIRDWIAQGAHPEPFAPAIPGDVLLQELFPAGTFSRALGLVNAGDGSNRVFVVRQIGTIEAFEPGGSASVFMQLPGPLSSDGERGLLGLAFHPGFADNDRFFVNYTAGSGHPSGASTGDTVISEFRIDSATGLGDPDSERVLMTIAQDFSNHNGGQIKFGPDGYLYIGMGDGGGSGDPCNRAQTLDPDAIQTGGSCRDDPTAALLGKMLRIDVDSTTPPGSNTLCAAAPDGSAEYAVPADNPFVDEAACAEVWALGLRNPWRWSFDRATGDLWIGDVGQNRWEEVSFRRLDQPGGADFGWKRCEGPFTFPPQTPAQTCPHDHQFPVLHYPRSQVDRSVTGGYRYRGPILSLQGAYVYGDYWSGRIWFAWQTGTEQFETLEFSQLGSDLRSFGEDEAGNLYVVRNGGIWRFVVDGVFADRFEPGSQ